MKLVRTNLYKRKHKSGTVVWMVRWRDPESGLWMARTAGRSEAEAVATETQVRQALLLGKEPFEDEKKLKAKKEEDVLLETVIEQYFKSPHYLGISPHWQWVTRTRLQKHIQPLLGKKKLSELTEEVLYDFYFGLKNSGSLSNNTIRQYHIILCQVGDTYVDRYPGVRNPFRQLQRFSKRFKKQAPKRDINFLTPEELERMVAAASQGRSPRLLPFLKFQAGTGMRRSETLRLKWTDVDWASGFIHVRQSKNGKPRMIPIEPEVAKVLKSMPRVSDFVFVQPNGSPMDPGSFLDPLKAAAKRAGIEKRIDVHTLRHSYGSNKLRAGWGLKKVSVLLGHSDIAITAGVYSHLLDGDLKVRDEFRFDNSEEVTKMGGKPGASGQLNSELAATVDNLIQQLKTLHLAHRQSKTPSESLGVHAGVADAVVSAVQKHLASTFDNEAKSATTTLKTGDFATLMLRADGLRVDVSELLRSLASEKLFDFDGLSGLKVAHPRGLEPLTLRSED
jgi:integrase